MIQMYSQDGSKNDPQDGRHIAPDRWAEIRVS